MILLWEKATPSILPCKLVVLGSESFRVDSVQALLENPPMGTYGEDNGRVGQPSCVNVELALCTELFILRLMR